MSPWLHRLYLRLPYPLRCLAASCHGARLKRWRYGPRTDALVAQALADERLPLDELRARQQRLLADVLQHAAEHVPYYRNGWAKLGAGSPAGRDAEVRELENWPILEKEQLRQSPQAFLADGCDPRRMYHEHTSGTTGKPVDLWWSHDTVTRWYALLEARWRNWYGVSRSDRWGILGGQIIVDSGRGKPPFWVWNSALRQLYLSSYHLAPRHIPAYLDAIVAHRVRYLWGYSSALHTIAEEALRLGRNDVRLQVVIANAEPLSDVQRETIGAAFHCPVRATYGMAEIVAAAGECEAGRLHLWPEVGVLEVLDDAARPVAPGMVGDLVCTGLFNQDMPLIRYRIGDRGALDEDPSPCPCGRTLPRLKTVEGRCDDVLYTKDGRRIGRLDPVFKSRLPIREAQIIQERLDLVVVRLVPAPDYTPEAGAAIVERLRDRLGDMTIRVEPVERIERTSNGKLRAVICRIPPADLARVSNPGSALP